MIPHTTTQTPAYHITVDDTDVTHHFQGRLVSLTLSDAAGFEADQLDITINDHDGLVELPKTGALLGLKLGFKGEDLIDKGTYTVDEIEHSGPPDLITIRARSADINTGFKAQKKKAWDQTTLGDIITDIANTYQLEPAPSDELTAIEIAHIDQTDESDAHFLTRLGKQYNAIATVKNKKLLFIRRGGGKSAGGNPLPTVTIHREDGDSHRYARRAAKHSGVRANWKDTDQAKPLSVLIGEEGNVKTLRNSYPTETEARHAANAEWQRISQDIESMELKLATADLALIPELFVKLDGWKAQIVEKKWYIVGNVKHQLDDALTTSLTLALVNEK